MGWPGYRATAWHQAAKQFSTHLWFGSLVDGMRDASGQMYMRNRYYDPATGQFTQADPIGLAGGLNAYGFAAGDPVAYSDPFGLCAEGGDTIKLAVKCPDGTLGEEPVAINKVTDPAQIQALMGTIGALQGGTASLPGSVVVTALFDVVAGGEVYSIPAVSIHGNPVTALGASWENGVAFHIKVWGALKAGDPNRQISPTRTACMAVGHEGAHHVIARTGGSYTSKAAESAATTTNPTWTCQ